MVYMALLVALDRHASKKSFDSGMKARTLLRFPALDGIANPTGCPIVRSPAPPRQVHRKYIQCSFDQSFAAFSSLLRKASGSDPPSLTSRSASSKWSLNSACETAVHPALSVDISLQVQQQFHHSQMTSCSSFMQSSPSLVVLDFELRTQFHKAADSFLVIVDPM